MREGFTLAELLIALAILGVIATFTIPKVLQSQQDGKYKAMAKEGLAAVSEAYQAYKLKNSPATTMKAINLAPYFNYVKYSTSGMIDDNYEDAGIQLACSDVQPCMWLANGSVLAPYDVDFAGSASTNSIWFVFDPNGSSNDSTTNGPGKGLDIVLYYDGAVRTLATLKPSTYSGWGGPWDPNPSKDPPWFNWN